MSENVKNAFVPDDGIERGLDEFVLQLGERIAKDESGVSIMNPMREENVDFVYKVLRYLTRDDDSVTLKRDDVMYPSMASISLEAEAVTFTDMKWFLRAAEFASNLDVYPLTNGKIRMTFGFHGMTKKLSED